MSVTNLPCAYCGTTSTTRTKGHVLSRSIYPTAFSFVPRITVAECEDCKSLWESAEPQFRNLLVAIWDSTELPRDSRTEKMMRSFKKSDGAKRATEVLNRIVATPVGDKIYPLKDEGFNLILRRIVRGLSHHHGVRSAVEDRLVLCIPVRYEIHQAFRDQIIWETIGENFFTYGYAPIFENRIASFWDLRFSNHIRFYGIVSTD